MIITIDTDNKIFKVKNGVQLGDLISQLKILVPEDWKEYTIMLSNPTLQESSGIIGGIRTNGFNYLHPDTLNGIPNGTKDYTHPYTLTVSGDATTIMTTDGNR